MNINKALRNSRLMKSLSGLSPLEFNELAKLFATELVIVKQRKKDRIRAIGGGRRGILPDHLHKLFYILFYFKAYPTFDMASFVFNTSRSKACEWVKKYQPILV